MTNEEAIELFNKAHFLHEQIDMKNDIDNIQGVLSQCPVDIFQVESLIGTVNSKHPENITIFNIIFPPQGNPVPLDSASVNDKICDLTWKLKYLQAKQTGKAFEEFRKAITQGDQNGGLM